MPKESITLYFKEGTADKVYAATIDESPDGFSVNFQYGRRGSALQTGSKTSKPLPFDDAKKIFDKLVREKTTKGYKPDAAGAEYVNASREERDTGLRPQLLNSIEEDECQKLLGDQDFWMQEKHDGRRCLLKRVASEVVGTNRMGLAVGLPKAIVDAILSSPTEEVTLDGELMGDYLVAFDMVGTMSTAMSSVKHDCLHKPYSGRLALLEKLRLGDAIKMVETAKTTSEKKAMYERLKKENKEGVVFKRHDAIYKPGRPSSGGDQLKFKFYATLSAVVAEGRKGKRSVALQLLEGGKGAGRWIPVGNVTVPANQPIPNVGQIVEVRYLYGYPNGSLFQPTLLGIRDDLAATACVTSQIKYKATDTDEEA